MGKYFDPKVDKPRKYQEYYWYLTGTSKDTGRSLFAGPFNTEEEASDKGFRLFDGAFETYKLRTSHAPTAKSMIKWKDLDETSDFSAIRPLYKVKDQ